MIELTYTNLYAFIKKAGDNTYAGGGRYEENPEREGFRELVYEDGDYYYRDSFTGWIKSWGTEIVRYKGQPVWNTLYGGGMVEGKEDLSRETFKFLKTALSAEDPKLLLFRGPKQMRLGDWRYHYEQEGDIKEFHGEEKITYQKQTVFTHRIIGGIVQEKKMIEWK